MAAELKSKFAGKWVNTKSENLKEYLEKAGVGMIKRNIALQLTPTLDISVEGEKITACLTAGQKTVKVSYSLGEEYDVEGDNPGKGKTTMVDGKMKTEITPNDKKIKPQTIVRDVDKDEQLVQTMTVDGVTAVRYFKKTS